MGKTDEYKDKIAKKSKSTFQKVIFSRLGLFAALLLIQILVICAFFITLGNYSSAIFVGMYILSAITTIYILNKNDDPAFQITWIIPVIVLPIAGVMLYLYTRTNAGMRRFKKSLNNVIKDTERLIPKNDDVLSELSEESQNALRISNYVYRYGGYPTLKNTDVKYFSLGDYAYKQILRELKMAKSFIFLEFFILEEGKMWNSILEILEQKVAEGVEVRVMYDGMGSALKLPTNYIKKLRSKSINAKIFNPIRPVLSTVQNNRDHRKIMIIDGKVAFTGGINLADEYINEKMIFGHWKDCAIMLRGEAVRNFTLMFLQLWNVKERKKKDEYAYTKYLNTSMKVEANGYVTAYSDSPLDSERVGEMVYLNIIYAAKDYVHIMTPYLIISSEMITALTTAAKSGIDVKILIPHIPDKWYAFVIAKSYYPVLIKAGVKIYEYTPGFVHSKVFVSDNRKAVVGTINMDFRSLYLHFECAAFMYKTDCIPSIEADFQESIDKSQRITMADYKKNSLKDRVLGRVFRLFAPLL